MRKLRYLIALLLLLPICLHASRGIIIGGTINSPVSLKPYFAVFEDSLNNVTAKSLLTRQDLFVSAKNFSHLKKTNTFWLRADIEATTTTDVCFTFGRVSHVTYYLYAGEQLIKEGKTGKLRPESEISPGDGRFYGSFTLHPDTLYTVLLQTNDVKNYPPIFDFKLHDKETYIYRQYRSELVDTAVFGAMIILLLYTVISWVATRSRPYIWLAIFITGISFYDLTLGSYLINWFFPDRPMLGWIPTINFLHMGLIGLYLLLIDFWKLKEYSPLFYRLGVTIILWMGALSLINGLTNIYTSNFYLSALINQYFSTVHVLFIGNLVFHMWRHLDRPRRFLGYGLLLFLCAVLSMTLALFIMGEKAFAIMPFFVRIVMLSVVLLFLTGLKEELRKIETDKTTYLKELTKLQKHQNMLLEERVARRTKSLRERNTHIEILINELNHRVKNNLQLLYSLNKLQIPSLPAGPAKNLLQDNISRIRAMILVNENFNNTDNSQALSLERFATDIIDYSASIFDPEHRVDISQQIDPDILLEVGLGLPFGLILSELVTNSYKHAFDDQEKPEITISVQSDGDNILFYYTDNGSGTVNQKPDSFGVQLIYDLTRQLKGSVSASSAHGLTYKFIIPLI